MNIVIVSCCSPVDIYLIRRIEQHWPVRAVIRPLGLRNPSGDSRWAKLCKAPLSTITKRLRGIFHDWRDKQRDLVVRQSLFGTLQTPTVPACIDIPDWAINSKDTACRLQQLEPDILLVRGAPILKPRIFRIPKLGALNIHFGIAPKYRGEHTIFWPLYLGDFENVGVTLHYIDKHVDSGNILAHGYPALATDDTEATIWAQCARLGADLATEFLQAAETGPVAGRPQQVPGRQFYARDRKIWRELHYAWKRHVLKVRPPCRPGRTVKYFALKSPEPASLAQSSARLP